MALPATLSVVSLPPFSHEHTAVEPLGGFFLLHLFTLLFSLTGSFLLPFFYTGYLGLLSLPPVSYHVSLLSLVSRCMLSEVALYTSLGLGESPRGNNWIIEHSTHKHETQNARSMPTASII